jgi:hypothetical protein
VATDDRISADQHADAARDALATYRTKSLYASSELQRGSVEALLAIDERLRGLSITRPPSSLAGDLELIGQLPPGPERQRLLHVAEEELERRLRSRREVSRDVGQIVGGILITGGGIALSVPALGYLHGSWWVLLLACLLFVMGVFTFADGVILKRREAAPSDASEDSAPEDSPPEDE